MKLILSRKGFDSANGGCPSPILDSRLCSLPIPDPGASMTYAEISPFRGSSIARIVEDLTHGRVRRSDGAHLDVRWKVRHRVFDDHRRVETVLNARRRLDEQVERRVG